jgi:hypothetical protein
MEEEKPLKLQLKAKQGASFAAGRSPGTKTLKNRTQKQSKS